MPFFFYEDTAEESNKSHDRGKDKCQTIISGRVKTQAAKVCPETAAKMVNRPDEARNQSHVREAVKSSKQGGTQRSRDNKGGAECQRKNIKGKSALKF